MSKTYKKTRIPIFSDSLTRIIKWKPAEKQKFAFGNKFYEIDKPNKGTIMTKRPKPSNNILNDHNSQIERFVVIQIKYRTKGNNKGTAYGLLLNKILYIDGINIKYRIDESIFLDITNHGNWFSLFQKNFDCIFEKELPFNQIPYNSPEGKQEIEISQYKNNLSLKKNIAGLSSEEIAFNGISGVAQSHNLNLWASKI